MLRKDNRLCHTIAWHFSYSEMPVQWRVWDCNIASFTWLLPSSIFVTSVKQISLLRAQYFYSHVQMYLDEKYMQWVRKLNYHWPNAVGVQGVLQHKVNEWGSAVLQVPLHPWACLWLFTPLQTILALLTWSFAASLLSSIVPQCHQSSGQSKAARLRPPGCNFQPSQPMLCCNTHCRYL